MNPAPSKYSLFFKALRFKIVSIGKVLNTIEGAG